MAKLPSTIYAIIEKKQRKLYKDGLTDGSLALGDVYAVFGECGYKQSTANKWLLNWAVSHRCKFEKDKGGNYRVRLGEFYELSPNDLLDGGKVWLPCKEVWVKNGKDAQTVII